MRKLLLLLVIGCGLFHLRAEVVKPDSVRISLLTCAPGEEIYALFGHTAIRYENYTRHEDWVFNYGMFSFNTPNFILRFLLGKTDYQLGIIPYPYFEAEYAERGSDVYHQELNLTEEEKQRFVRLLKENYLPKNRIYRYNYFYDNCTTRARDKIEECIKGKVKYPQSGKTRTYRDIVREFTDGHDWESLGIDCCLGADADIPIDERKQMFAPFYMLEAARGATIVRGDSVVPFVLAETKVESATLQGEKCHFPVGKVPFPVGLLALTCLIAWWSIRIGKVIWIWDVLLFGAQGVGGCIIAALFFFSVHPTVDTNWLVAILNPIPLLYLPVMVYRAIKHKKDAYHWVNAAYLTFFMILMPFLPQEFDLTVLPLAACLLICSVGHLFLYNKKPSFK